MQRLALALCLLAVGCASTKEQEQHDVLPFHVAVIPIQVTAEERSTELAGEETELDLDLSEAEVSLAIVDALDETFTRATLLDYPADRATFPSSREEQDAYWVQQAIERRADLILEGTLVYDPDLNTGKNEKHWTNFLLFSLGGPATWYMNDRSYYYDVSLEAHLHDLNPIAAEAASLQDRRSELVIIPVDVDETATDFNDRADGGSYGVSIFWPSTYLEVESEGARQHVQEQILEQLGELSVERIQGKPDELIRARKIVDFYPEDLRLEQTPEGPLLTGSFVLELGEVDRMGELIVRMGDATVQEASFDSGVLDASSKSRYGTRRFPVRIPVPSTNPDETIQIVVSDGSLEQNRRTFTYSLGQLMDEQS